MRWAICSSLAKRVCSLAGNCNCPDFRWMSRMTRPSTTRSFLVWALARSSPISSLYANHTYLADTGFDINNSMSSRCRNQRVHTACNTPTTSVGLWLVIQVAIPVAICSQNCRSTSRRSDGTLGERIAPLPVNLYRTCRSSHKHLLG